MTNPQLPVPRLLLLDGRAKFGNFEEADAMDAATSETEAVESGRTIWKSLRRNLGRSRIQEPGAASYSAAAGPAAGGTCEMTCRRIWLTTCVLPISERSLCSHTLRTRIPFALSSRATRRARFLLPSILDRQYLRFAFGSRKHRGHPCQKHPSTKTATRPLGNQKSGCPGMERGCIRHPLVLDLTSASLNCFSVERLPIDRTFDIKALRSCFVRVSILNGSEVL